MQTELPKQRIDQSGQLVSYRQDFYVDGKAFQQLLPGRTVCT